ncbi:MAG TPA: helix-turn-helix domain-containing protein [Anaerolineales bacterium]|nr:helix-turn-helix domain-containing protein [Anaerolineales bacterium]
MPKARNYQMSEGDLQAVERAIRHDKRPEVRQRCTAIRLLHLGHKPEEIAEMQAVSIPTIYGWIKPWRTDRAVDVHQKRMRPTPQNW